MWARQQRALWLLALLCAWVAACDCPRVLLRVRALHRGIDTKECEKEGERESRGGRLGEKDNFIKLTLRGFLGKAT